MELIVRISSGLGGRLESDRDFEEGGKKKERTLRTGGLDPRRTEKKSK